MESGPGAFPALRPGGLTGSGVDDPDFSQGDKASLHHFVDGHYAISRLNREGLDALCAKLSNAGIKPLYGIVSMNDGTRAAVVRDPDAGAFVELFERN